jgi:transposase
MRREELRAAIDRDPEAIVELVMTLSASVAALRAEVDELKRQLGRDSRNSSLPPSRDSPAARAKRPRKGSGRKQGGQPGHPGSHRELVADSDHVVEHWPDACGRCSAPIAAKDRQAAGDAVCHQVTDIVVRVEVTEHRRMRTRCSCGCRTLADLPVGVPAGAFGPAVAAAAATLTAARLSRRDSARLLGDLCGVTISAASVERLVKQAADALEDPYMQIVKAVDDSPVRGADETSWRQAGQTTWLSVAVAQTAALFQLDARRDRDAAMALLGEAPSGTIVSDRYAVYLYIDDSQRQLCLAHLLRDFVALGERAGAPGRLGRALARVLGDVFTALKQPRNLDELGILRADTAEQRERLHALLAKGARCRDAKTKRFCAGLLAHEDALWTFTRVIDVPATNNAAERALRHAVMWRKISYGTQTEHGNRLVERLLSIRETCRLQGRRLHDYLTAAITADLNGQPIPTPLPP